MQRRLILSLSLTLTVLACGREERVMKAIDAGPPLPVVNCLDSDGDGVPGTGACGSEAQVDCRDDDPLAYPGANELCNDRDDDCDGEVDE
ncbi:MAG: putative metal-binding motif-containing protein, partial [Myxococcaceae bacterium]|nr:putative metal-binding motif-containing protein [Myxococcaceae bacterium]